MLRGKLWRMNDALENLKLVLSRLEAILHEIDLAISELAMDLPPDESGLAFDGVSDTPGTVHKEQISKFQSLRDAVEAQVDEIVKKIEELKRQR